MKKNLRAGCYCRVSTGKQRDKGLSLHDQQEELKKYCLENNFIVNDFYIDGGISGGKLSRPELNRLMKDVESHNIDIVLFTHIDRFGRDTKNYYLLESVLEEHGVTWEAVCEKHDTSTAAGNLSFSVQQGVAEFTRRQTAEKVIITMRHKKERGEPCNGSAVLGYQILNKKMIPNPETTPVVKAMFDYYEKHGHLYNTNQMMRDNYFPNTNIETTGRRLRNKIYIGIYDRGDVYNDSYCEPIISKEQFYKVQELLKKNTKKKANRRNYIFSKMIKCGACGNGFKGGCTSYKLESGEKGETKYYCCQGTYFKKSCNNRNCIGEKVLENYLLEYIKIQISHIKLDVEIIDTYNPKSDLEKEKGSVIKKLENLKNLYLNNLILLDQYKNDFEAFTEHLEALNKKIEEIPVKPKNDAQALKELVESGILNNYQQFTDEEKRKLWISIIDKIIVHDKEDYEVIFK